MLARVIAWWKANRGWTMAADIHRLESADPAVLAEAQVAPDRLALRPLRGPGGGIRADAAAAPAPGRARPSGALRDAPGQPRGRAPPRAAAPVALREGPLTLSGAALMAHGLRLPVAWPATMWVVEGRAVAPVGHSL